MRRVLVTAAIGVIAGLALAAGAGFWSWRTLNAPLRLPADGLVVQVEPGTALGRLADRLGESGVLPEPRLLTLYARFTGDATRVKAGEYVLEAGLTPLTLLDKMIAGDVVLHSFTIVEGWRFDEFLSGLRSHPAVTAGTLDGSEIMATLGREGLHPEGQFLPDTYLFPRGTTDISVLRQAHDALQQALDESWDSRAADIALESPYQALILASIIEKETALAGERPLISGVFHERLRIGMRLQTDPTVIYGLGADFDGNLRRRDLDSDTPYNTYTRRGLPPTPIALPSAAAIQAAVRPESNGALYFVATGKSDGSHTFSRTIDEHNAAVREYLRTQRED
jgi:UPF0755 protein